MCFSALGGEESQKPQDYTSNVQTKKIRKFSDSWSSLPQELFGKTGTLVSAVGANQSVHDELRLSVVIAFFISFFSQLQIS